MKFIVLQIIFIFFVSSIYSNSPNILFIVSDDLRCTIGAYGDQIAKTPSIDKLAEEGTVFKNAYCQQALCNPSRSSFLTGLRPDTLKIWNLSSSYRKTTPKAVTLPEYLKKNGYYTEQIGKIHHGSGEPSRDSLSWSTPQVYHHATKKQAYVLPNNQTGKKATASEVGNTEDHKYIDGKVASMAVTALSRLKKNKQPFMLAIGFRKPHLPFAAPKKYWDLYNREEIPILDHRPPVGAVELAHHDSREIYGYSDIDKGKISLDKRKELWHGYYAAVSFMDAQVGKVLSALRDLELDHNTIVVFLSDHGFHLSEHGLWCKTSNYEIDARVPLIYKDPRIKQGNETHALVELVDLFPSIVASCRLTLPKNLEGTSFNPVLTDSKRQWKKAAFTQHPRPAYYKGIPKIMGYSIRTNRFRYTEWRNFKSSDVLSKELYDHENDPGETVNLIDHHQYKKEHDALKTQLQAGWRGALPPLLD